MPQSYFIRIRDLNQKRTITRLILAEGLSEVGLADAYLNHVGADINQVAVVCFEGVSKIVAMTKTLAKILAPTETDLQNLMGFCMLADADDNPQARLDTAIDVAKALAFPRCATDIKTTGRHVYNGRKFAASLSPSNIANGRIEDLVLTEARTHPIYACLQAYETCLRPLHNGQVNDKALAQIFISSVANNSLAGIGRGFTGGFLDVTNAAYLTHANAIDFAIT